MVLMPFGHSLCVRPALILTPKGGPARPRPLAHSGGRRVRAVFPRACALGYMLSPPPGLARDLRTISTYITNHRNGTTSLPTSEARPGCLPCTPVVNFGVGHWNVVFTKPAYFPVVGLRSGRGAVRCGVAFPLDLHAILQNPTASGGLSVRP